VLRAKYFPDGNLLAAKPVNEMSYVWRSILKGLEVLKEGIIWRIGDGSRVHIWDDPWLLRGVTRRPSTYTEDCPHEFVSELIDEETCTWKRDLIIMYFATDDVPIILSIPLREHTEDFLAWHFDPRGQFSVKSAYKVHVEMEKQAVSKQMGENRDVFKQLWNVQCPPKVHFLWRLAHNSHPLYMNIARRGIELDTRCAICHKYFEDGGHLFLQCKLAKQRWRALQLEDVRLKLLPLSESEKLLAISLLWNWWHERNKSRHGEHQQSVEEFQFNARRHVDEWKSFIAKKKNPNVSITADWEAPPENFVKINLDASFFEAGKNGGWGAICRNSEAFAAAGPLVLMTDALHAEATSLFNAIQIAEQMGVSRVIFETDCLNLKQARIIFWTEGSSAASFH
jgi:hypothetical protein